VRVPHLARAATRGVSRGVPQGHGYATDNRIKLFITYTFYAFSKSIRKALSKKDDI
jgi:hypothetical protein